MTYKDSGIEWIGEIPENWNLERLVWHLEEVKENNDPIKTNDVLSLTNKLGVVPYEDKGAQGNVAKEDYTQYKIAYPDTIVANSMNILIGSVGICNYYGCVSPVYYVYKAKKDTSLEFINYIFQTEQFQKELRKYANGILEIRLRVSSNDILKQTIAIPSYNEQIKVVNEINARAEQLKSLTDNLNAQIDKLKDYKKALITKCVTKGLDPNVPLKDSGINDVEKIPKNWSVCKLKYICASHNSNYSKDMLFNEGVYPVYGASGVETGYLDTFDYDKPYLGIVKDGAGVGRVDIFPANSSLLATMAYIYPSQSIELRWLKYLITSLDLGLSLDKTTIPHIYFSDYGNRYIAFCGLPEQIEIADYLDKKCSEIDALISSKQQQIDKLNEYQKSLIYEYVTGKKEVV